MGLFSNFTGGDTRRDIRKGYGKYRDTVRDYGASAGNILTGSYDNYAALGNVGQQGADAYSLYGASLGLEGDEGYQRAFETFEADPFREYANQNTENVLRDTFRRYNAAGMGDSGASRLGVGRVAGEFARRDVDDWRNRLSGAGQYGIGAGFNVANALTGVDTRRASLETNIGNALANAYLNENLGVSGTRSTGLNNLFKIGELAVSAMTGMPTGGTSGQSVGIPWDLATTTIPA